MSPNIITGTSLAVQILVATMARVVPAIVPTFYPVSMEIRNKLVRGTLAVAYAGVVRALVFVLLNNTIENAGHFEYAIIRRTGGY